MSILFNSNGKISKLLMRVVFMLALSAAGMMWGCSSAKPTSDADMKEIDRLKMSMRLDREDINRLFELNYEQLVESDVYRAWIERSKEGKESQAVLVTYPIRDETGLNNYQPLSALLAKFETRLVQQKVVAMIGGEQPLLIQEYQRQASTAYDRQRVAQMGKQIGAQYILSGVMAGVAESTSEAERVQYFLQIHVIDVETGEIIFRNVSAVEPTAAKVDL